MPPGFENAPEWLQTLFYGIMALGAAYFAVVRMAVGARDETRIVQATGRASTVEEVIDGPALVKPAGPTMESFGIMGGSLVSRQIAEDNLLAKKALVEVLERLEKLAERSLAIQERRHVRDEEDDRREELREEALKVLKEMGVPLGENGVPILQERPGQRQPRRG